MSIEMLEIIVNCTCVVQMVVHSIFKCLTWCLYSADLKQ